MKKAIKNIYNFIIDKLMYCLTTIVFLFKDDSEELREILNSPD